MRPVYTAKHERKLHFNIPAQWSDKMRCTCTCMHNVCTMTDQNIKILLRMYVRFHLDVLSFWWCDVDVQYPRSARCVYWDERGQYWADDGLTKLSFSGFTTTCCSSHLTFFAVASVSVTIIISVFVQLCDPTRFLMIRRPPRSTLLTAFWLIVLKQLKE